MTCRVNMLVDNRQIYTCIRTYRDTSRNDILSYIHTRTYTVRVDGIIIA